MHEFQTQNSCHECHTSCRTCIGSNSSQCDSCFDGDYRIGESPESSTFACSSECQNGVVVELPEKRYNFCKINRYQIPIPSYPVMPNIPTTEKPPDPVSNQTTNNSIYIFTFGCIVVVIIGFISYHRCTRIPPQKFFNHPIEVVELEENKIESIPMRYLDTKSKKRIGCGGFGTVYECIYNKPNGESVKVAVKVMKANNIDQKKQMFEELENMMRIPRHPHVLRLLGVNMKDDLILIMPRRQDNLKSYLARKTVRLPKDQLTRFCVQIADGMFHLHSIPILHCDLKASNVLVKDEFTVQISDFGLSFHENDNNGRFRGGTITHLALELVVRSLEPHKVTKMTDVWAFGVTAWEIWTMARTKPYEIEGLTNQDQVAGYLRDGSRLTKPEYMPQELWNKVLQCFHNQPEVRPDFHNIYSKFARLMPETVINNDPLLLDV